MKLAIHDPSPPLNDYVSKMFLAPLEQFARHSGITVKRIADPIPEFGWTMICNAGLLNRDIIRHFDSNRCTLVAISCNDSAYLTEQLNHPDLWLVPLVFTISGVQKVNHSEQSVMNQDMTVTTREVEFLPQGGWEIYDQMRREGRLLPLPYVPWDRLPDVQIPEYKNPSILFRGGNHFWRFVAYLHALKAGVAHPASGFLTQDYFSDGPEMQERFRFCQQCRTQYRKFGNRMTYPVLETCDCPKVDLENPLGWNNRTPRYFLNLAKQWFRAQSESTSEYREELHREELEQALNFRRQSAEHHLRAIADAAFFCDAKWEFSIHTAQRFWEAAAVGTVNLLPDRANDQQYFPNLELGVHYWTFYNDFSDLGKFAPEVAQYLSHQISPSAKALYEEWIRPSDYVTNTNLLRHILAKITEVVT